MIAINTDNPIQLAKNGKILLELGDIENSKESLEKAIEQLPNLSRTWYNLGLIAYKENKHVEATEYLKKAYLFNKNNVFIQNYLSKDNIIKEENIDLLKDLNFLFEKYKIKYRAWYRTIHMKIV